MIDERAKSGPSPVPTAPAPSVPIIDMALLRADAPTDARHATLQTLASACQTSGVFYVQNHGAPDGVIERSVALFDQFFELPEQERMKIAVREGESSGYVPLHRGNGEFNDSVSCIGVLEPVGAPGASSILPRPNDNKWPEQPEGLRESVGATMHAMHEVGRVLLAAMAESLDATPAWFDDLLGPSDAGALRARRYPPQSTSTGRVGTAAHEDGPPLALIVQNDVPGLETYIEGLGFVALPQIPGTLVCQLGLLFTRITNHRFRPNLHRVVNLHPARERRSLIYWFPFRTDALVRTIPTCESPDAPPRYAPIRFDQFLREWIDTF